jgi:hypothetical protein
MLVDPDLTVLQAGQVYNSDMSSFCLYNRFCDVVISLCLHVMFLFCTSLDAIPILHVMSLYCF